MIIAVVVAVVLVMASLLVVKSIGNNIQTDNVNLSDKEQNTQVTDYQEIEKPTDPFTNKHDSYVIFTGDRAHKNGGQLSARHDFTTYYGVKGGGKTKPYYYPGETNVYKPNSGEEYVLPEASVDDLVIPIRVTITDKSTTPRPNGIVTSVNVSGAAEDVNVFLRYDSRDFVEGTNKVVTDKDAQDDEYHFFFLVVVARDYYTGNTVSLDNLKITTNATANVGGGPLEMGSATAKFVNTEKGFSLQIVYTEPYDHLGKYSAVNNIDTE